MTRRLAARQRANRHFPNSSGHSRFEDPNRQSLRSVTISTATRTKANLTTLQVVQHTMQSSTIARRSLLNAVGTAPALRTSASKPVFAALAQRRSAATQALTPQEHLSLLNEQRLRRPGSPHLEIYQMQLTMLLSGSHRATGNAMSIGLYAGAMTYLLHPYFPILDSAHLIDAISTLPEWLKGAGRFALALPFTFHTFNGIRHLGWDLGKFLTIKGVYATGYATIAATFLSSAYLAFFF